MAWFPDTSALVTLAVHPPLQRAVAAALSVHNLVLVESVVSELKGLAGTSDPAAAWAGTPLGQLDWLGEPVRVDDPVGTQLAVELQELIAGGRPLTHDMQHYGEAAIISLASRAQRLQPDGPPQCRLACRGDQGLSATDVPTEVSHSVCAVVGVSTRASADRQTGGSRCEVDLLTRNFRGRRNYATVRRRGSALQAEMRRR